ncbi:hypothetical protein KPL47_22570 [Clostridium estertheticum]|uniref:hypothetical protein n=1 Tax=Clostridium estertheticum TaxID=238834 RepID=UPI001C0CE3B2|nr:hypothetical protein [Clostridium estertheticum]MBU3179084.1 hypothetical protein [Clostridium estertheticum]
MFNVKKWILLTHITEYMNVANPFGINGTPVVGQNITLKLKNFSEKQIIHNFISSYSEVEKKYLKRVGKSICMRTHTAIVRKILRRYNIDRAIIKKLVAGGKCINIKAYRVTYNNKDYKIDVKFLKARKLIEKALFKERPLNYLKEHFDDKEMNVNNYKVIITRVK